jgi:hypothetical protein
MTITAMEPSSDTTVPLSSTDKSQNVQEPGETADLETAEGNANDDDDDVTVIILEHGAENQNHSGWADQNTPEMEQRT